MSGTVFSLIPPVVAIALALATSFPVDRDSFRGGSLCGA